jgi:hypothetical protein
MTKNTLSIRLLVFVAVIVLWYILSRSHFGVGIPVSLGGMILFAFGGIVVLYLVLDHVLIRSFVFPMRETNSSPNSVEGTSAL